jgi:excisionase family DNA binding protein
MKPITAETIAHAPIAELPVLARQLAELERIVTARLTAAGRAQPTTERAAPLLPSVDVVATLDAPALAGFVTQLAALVAAAGARFASPSRRDDGPDRLLTVKQAAPILGMSEDWIYRNAGQLPFTRRTGRRTLRFSERGLKRYLADREA